MSNRKARFRKVLAAVLALSMILGSSMTVFADVTPMASPQTDSAESNGTVEAWLDTDVFRVELPTVSDANFALILDPKGAINQTNQAAYSGKTFESNQYVFFRNTSGNAAYVTDYSHKSDVVSVNNTGGVSINVAVQVSVNDADGIKFVDTNSFDAEDKMAKMYIAVVPTDENGTLGNEAAVSNNKAAKVSENVAGTPANFTVSYDSARAAGKKYFLSENATPVWKNMKFQLVAGLNKNGDFADLNAPKIDIVWTIKDASGPSIRLSKDGLVEIKNLSDTQDVSYTGTFPADASGSKFGGVAFYNVDDDTFYYVTADESWDISKYAAGKGGNIKIQLRDGWLSSWKGKEVYAKLYLTDGTSIDSTHVMW